MGDEQVSLGDRISRVEERIEHVEVQLGNTQRAVGEAMTRFDRLSSQIDEWRGESRARGESQEAAARKEAETTRSDIKDLGRTLSKLGSLRGWVGWALVTAASAGVGQVLTHLGLSR